MNSRTGSTSPDSYWLPLESRQELVAALRLPPERGQHPDTPRPRAISETEIYNISLMPGQTARVASVVRWPSAADKPAHSTRSLPRGEEAGAQRTYVAYFSGLRENVYRFCEEEPVTD